jgi:DNA (cytosine-5)-methyltransferase 1
MRFGTMFSGGGLADVGLRAAGLDHAWGVELDPARVAVARANGLDVMCADVLAVDAASLERVDWLHASPPCTEYSQANRAAGTRETGRGTDMDLRLALAVGDVARELRPAWVSVENVMGWRGTAPERALSSALEAMGYRVQRMQLNAADFGVPQHRARFFLVAGLAGVPRMPEATHTQGGGWWSRPWVGWEQACPDWRELELRPLTDRMAALNTYADRKNLLVNSNTKNHREKVIASVIVDGRYHGAQAKLVQGGTHQPLQDAQGVRLPIYRREGEAAPAMTTRSVMQVVASEGARTLTARHVARLAGLPDSWHLPATLTMTREVCGLGVCPPVMTAIVAAQGL